MNRLLIVIASLVVVGGVSTAFAWNEYGDVFIEKHCIYASWDHWNWNHLKGWCSVIDSQNKIIDQNEEIIDLLKLNNCLSLYADLEIYEKRIKCNYDGN